MKYSLVVLWCVFWGSICYQLDPQESEHDFQIQKFPLNIINEIFKQVENYLGSEFKFNNQYFKINKAQIQPKIIQNLYIMEIDLIDRTDGFNRLVKKLDVKFNQFKGSNKIRNTVIRQQSFDSYNSYQQQARFFINNPQLTNSNLKVIRTNIVKNSRTRKVKAIGLKMRSKRQLDSDIKTNNRKAIKIDNVYMPSVDQKNRKGAKKEDNVISSINNYQQIKIHKDGYQQIESYNDYPLINDRSMDRNYGQIDLMELNRRLYASQTQNLSQVYQNMQMAQMYKSSNGLSQQYNLSQIQQQQQQNMQKVANNINQMIADDETNKTDATTEGYHGMVSQNNMIIDQRQLNKYYMDYVEKEYQEHLYIYDLERMTITKKYKNQLNMQTMETEIYGEEEVMDVYHNPFFPDIPYFPPLDIYEQLKQEVQNQEYKEIKNQTVQEFVDMLISEIKLEYSDLQFKEKIIDDTFVRVDGERDHILLLSFVDMMGTKKLFEGVIMEKGGIAGVYQVQMLTQEQVSIVNEYQSNIEITQNNLQAIMYQLQANVQNNRVGASMLRISSNEEINESFEDIIHVFMHTNQELSHVLGPVFKVVLYNLDGAQRIVDIIANLNIF